MTMKLAAALKSYFFVIVALISIIGSALAVPYISKSVDVSSGSDSSSLIPDASAQSLPFRADHHLQIKEKVGDPVRIEEGINDGDLHCEMSCKYIEYKPGSQGKAGLAFISDNPLDLSGAKKVHFFLMGEKGGETVKVKIAGKSDKANVTDKNAQKLDNPFKEKFAKSTDVITLPNQWQRYEVPLDGADLKDVVAPFAIELLKGKGPAKQVVYLKYIVFENEPVDQRFLLPANATSNATSNATNANNTMVEGNNSNTTTTADTPEAENNNNNNSINETATTTIRNTTADTTPGDEIINSTSIAPVEGQDDENLAPVAMLAVDSLVAHPGDRVILDGSASSDPNGNEITYHWSQSVGPSVEIMNADTITPTVTIPMLERDDVITIDLVVSDGQTESNKVSVVIDVQYLEEIEDAIEQGLPPDDDIGGEGWIDAACDNNSGFVDCLVDSSESTFVSSDRPGRTTDLLFSFQDPSTLGINSSNQIAYVTAQVTAKKIGPSGFTSLIVDDLDNDEHYSTPSISIVSDSFEDYSFNWRYNPVTGAPWTADSLNSLIAGYRYTAGQGSIQISEFTLIVGSPISQEEQEPAPPALSAIDGETSSAEEPGPAEGNGHNGSDEEGSTTNAEEEPVQDSNDVTTDEGASAEDGEQEGESNTESNENQQEDDPGQDDSTDTTNSDEPTTSE
jgi:hypothetical protein